MEKFRIALYGMTQVTAVVYGVLACGAGIKFNRYWLDLGYQMPDSYYRAIFYRDHGYYLLLLVLIWAAGMSYFSSQWSKRTITEDEISVYGLGLTIFFAVVGSVFAVGGFSQPPHLISGTTLP